MSFVLPALSGPNIYLLDRHYLSLCVRMVNKDGSAIQNIGIAEGSIGTPPWIGPINNVMHSLFDQVTCKIGNMDVNTSEKYYPWKSYVSSLLSYNSEAKSTWMTEFGW